MSGTVGQMIDTELVQQLISDQFPQWSDLPIRAVLPGGWDNRTFLLGPDLSVRLPSAAGYAAAVAKEQRWLPYLASRLSLPIPEPVAAGQPTAAYPYPWSVYRWIEGTPAAATIGDLVGLAGDVAGFLSELQRIDSTGGPGPGPHCWHRGGPLTVYAPETERALGALVGRIDTGAATEVWRAAVDATAPGPPVWFHGDIAPGNLLLRDGRLAAVIDFGTSGVGDPACDTVLAWTLLGGDSRAAFRAGLALDPGTWARGRGWALWKALIVLAEAIDTDPSVAAEQRRVVDEVVTDHRAESG